MNDEKDLKPFGSCTCCVKCGSKWISAAYRYKLDPSKIYGDKHGLVEWIKRTCSNCGYDWAEACLDSVSKKEWVKVHPKDMTADQLGKIVPPYISDNIEVAPGVYSYPVPGEELKGKSAMHPGKLKH